MIVDAHVHVLPDRVRTQGATVAATDAWFATCHSGQAVMASVESLLDAMDVAEVDRAVCFTWPFTSMALCAEGNDYLAAAVRVHPDRLVGFGCVQPADPGAADEVLRCARLGLRGIGELNADAQGWGLEDTPTLMPVVQASVDAGLVWTVHCSEPLGHAYAGKGTATPDRIAGFVDRFPELRLIAAHLGGGLPFYAHMPEVSDLCHRIWFDTAAVPFLHRPSAYRTVVDLCGAERLLFGSDHPLLNVDRYRAGLAAAGLSATERELIMGDSAVRLLGL